jgi:hypothetical protein
MAAILDFLLSPICLLLVIRHISSLLFLAIASPSAVQNGGEERFIVATTTHVTGEIKCVLGEFKLDEGAGTQLISGKVHHNQAFNGKEFAQLLTDLYYAVASEANSRNIMQVISMILLMHTHTTYI